MTPTAAARGEVRSIISKIFVDTQLKVLGSQQFTLYTYIYVGSGNATRNHAIFIFSVLKVVAK